MDKKKHLEVSSLGGNNKRGYRNNKDKVKGEDSPSIHTHKLEEILTDIENNEQV